MKTLEEVQADSFFSRVDNGELIPVPVENSRETKYEAGPINVLEIVRSHLENNGFDGLYYPGECACRLNDLCPCGETPLHCEPGYEQECTPDCGCGGFHIGRDDHAD